MTGRVQRHLRNHGWRRVMAFVAVCLGLLLGLFYVGGGWYFSGVIREDALLIERSPPDYPIEVAAVTEDPITLRVVGNLGSDRSLSGGQWDRDLWVGVGTEDTSGLVGPAIRRSATVATRRYIPPEGAPLRVGDRVRLDVRAFWPDPRRGLGQQFRTVAYSNPLGSYPSWRIAGERRDVWAIYVHGKGADRDEPLRLSATIGDAGLTLSLIHI